jgi:6-phosphogluconolactonase (cycloisomerase 2 family)
MLRNSLGSPFPCASSYAGSCARSCFVWILAPGFFSITAAVLVSLFFLAALSAAHAQGGTEYIVTNDDLAPELLSTLTVFAVSPRGKITEQGKIGIGLGILGGYFAAPRILSTNVGGTNCVFASAAYFGEITGVDMDTEQATGNFTGSATDSGMANGIGLAMNQTYLYAGYSSSGTIGTFAVGSDCSLSFIGDVAATGVNGGTPDGIALHGNLLIVTYEDGSMESFNTASGLPVSNDDLQLSTGYGTDNLPDSVQITADGHYAIFGDDSTATTVEVSDISSGNLAPTIVYNLGTAFNSNNVLLSPDQTLLYVTNNSSGQVTAAFFDAATGVVSPGCSSSTLKQFDNTWIYASGLGMASTTGSGQKLYVAEYGGPSSIGVVNVTSSGGQCTLKEDAHSPVAVEGASALMSLTVYTSQ